MKCRVFWYGWLDTNSFRSTEGLIITTGTFNRDARAEALRDGAPAIDLIDGQELASLLKQYEFGVKEVHFF